MRCGDEAYSYDAFGNVLGETEDTNPFLYCGEQFDYESGLLYLRARYYDSGVGAFVSEDPARDGLNWYSYCAGNPVNRIDPSGLAPFDYFSTHDEAEADFGLYIGQYSIDIGEELAAVIYEIEMADGKTYYFYDEPRNDLETHEERSIGFSILWDGSLGAAVSLAHTHGAYDANTGNTKDGFSYPGNVASGNDKNSDTYQSDKVNLDYYVETPTGNLRKLSGRAN